MSKEEILDTVEQHHNDSGVFYDEKGLLNAMDTYAKQQASAVINELEEQAKTMTYQQIFATINAINLIKKHFNIV